MSLKLNSGFHFDRLLLCRDCQGGCVVFHLPSVCLVSMELIGKFLIKKI